MTTRIGLISDTHGVLDPNVFRAFEDVDEIWHAGDFGDVEIIDRLEAFRPLRAVYGNIDDQAVRNRVPGSLRFTLEGVDVWITHIAGRPGRYPPQVRKTLSENRPDVLVCGHTHICHVQRDGRFGDLLYMNPGAAGDYGPHVMRTLLKCDVHDGLVDAVKVVELGPRGRRNQS